MSPDQGALFLPYLNLLTVTLGAKGSLRGLERHSSTPQKDCWSTGRSESKSMLRSKAGHCTVRNGPQLTLGVSEWVFLFSCVACVSVSLVFGFGTEETGEISFFVSEDRVKAFTPRTQ